MCVVVLLIVLQSSISIFAALILKISPPLGFEKESQKEAYLKKKSIQGP